MARAAGQARPGRCVHSHVRLYESLRTAHLERAHELSAASIVYGRRRYDFDENLATGLDLIQANLAKTARVLWKSRVSAIEVNEPLMSDGLRRGAVAIATLRLRHPLARPLVVSYAIENRYPGHGAPAGRSPLRRLRARLRRSLELALRGYVWRHLDRVAFGTSAARDLYRQVFGDLEPPGRRGRRAPATTLVPALPKPCSCGPVDPKEPLSALFLGALTERKGFAEVLAAWPAIAARQPGAHLAIVGKGPMFAEAQTLAQRPDVTLTVDPPRDEIHAQLRRSGVLVLPSRPTATWREQVGLPIVEGLAHGCTVVTTTETGLAPWLAQRGHHTLSSPSVDEVAEAITRSLRSPRPPAEVRYDLPGEDGRLAADRWLFAPRPARRGRR